MKKTIVLSVIRSTYVIYSHKQMFNVVRQFFFDEFILQLILGVPLHQNFNYSNDYSYLFYWNKQQFCILWAVKNMSNMKFVYSMILQNHFWHWPKFILFGNNCLNVLKWWYHQVFLCSHSQLAPENWLVVFIVLVHYKK